MAVEYKNAGVDVEAGYKAVALMKEHVKRTFNENVVTDSAALAAYFPSLEKRWRNRSLCPVRMAWVRS